jgi:5-methylcytosine-specific restriction endonuclease McrA
MPIDYSKYPKDWKTKIRPDILKRDENKCAFCGVENYTIGVRDKHGNLTPLDAPEKLLKEYNYNIIGGKVKPIKIVLTIAHLDHDRTNNDYSNLAALCQKCHLDHDRKDNQRRRSVSRRLKQIKSGQTSLI